MAEIINLRRARKTRARDEKEKTAQGNRVLHGTAKSVRKLAEAREEKAAKALSAHRLEPDK